MNAPHQTVAPLHIPGPLFGGWSNQTQQQNLSGPPAPAGPAVATGAAPAPAAPAAPAPAPAEPAAPAATPPVAPAAPAKTYTPEETEAYVARVNAEARTHREAREAAERTAAEATARSNAILAAAGFGVDGKALPPSTDELQQQLAQRDAERDQTARENLVLRIGTRPDVSANVDKLLDSRSFTDALSKLAVSDREGVEKLVKETLEKEPTYKAIIPAASSGSTTATGAGTPPTARKSKTDAIAARYNTPSS